MIRDVEAVYENGILRPLVPLPLADSQHVRITIFDGEPGHRLIDTAFQAQAMEGIPTLEEVQQMLSKIPGSLLADCIAEREER